jgi:two-component system response regulator HydG
MEILNRAKQALPDSEVIVVTGHGTVPKAVEAMQQGAFNFLEKPLNTERLRAVTEKAADAVLLKLANVDLHKRLDEKFGFEGIIYVSDKLQAVIDRLKRIAPTDATVLITGDTGTGKELVAQAIHQNSPRKKPFGTQLRAPASTCWKASCSGTWRRCTDAAADRGAFEYAMGARCFWTRSTMPCTQIKLPRAESGEIVRENKPVRERAGDLGRNRQLEDAVEEGVFRRDLYHRLKVVTIPLLRWQRRDDIVPLVDHFRKQFTSSTTERVASRAVTHKFSGHWPGNVRQLRDFIRAWWSSIWMGS